MQAERVLRVDCEPRSLVAIDSAKKHLVSTQPDGKITRWSLRKGHSDQLRGHMRRATCLAFSPRSDLLCTGSLDHSLRLFNMDGGECIGVLEGHEDEVTCPICRRPFEVKDLIQIDTSVDAAGALRFGKR